VFFIEAQCLCTLPNITALFVNVPTHGNFKLGRFSLTHNYIDTSCMQTCNETSVDNRELCTDKHCHDVVDSTAYTLCY